MVNKLDNELTNIQKLTPGFDWDSSGFYIAYEFWKTHVVDAKSSTLPDFARKFVKGYNNRPSTRKSKAIGTVPDKLIDILIQTRMPKFTRRDIDLIRFGHRLSMSAENILGLILEEYIHSKAVGRGWACCWGNCISKVDFCSSHIMLQVKNRSNDENSSSSKIRAGTRILKWHRINANDGSTNWQELDSIIGVSQLFSEGEYIDFATALIKGNPSALFVEQAELNKLFSD
jgi:hypothetical protein